MKTELPFWGAIIIVAILVVGSFFGRFWYMKHKPIINDYESCAQAGYPILESYPEQCKTPDGKTYVNPNATPVIPPPEEIPPPGETIGMGYVFGDVTIGPICPVEQEGHPCEVPPETYTSRKAVVYKADKKTKVTEMKLNADGTYNFILPYGNYYIEIVPAGIGRGEQKLIVIDKEKVEANFDIDTGIR